jgi:hypothetical protein
VDNSQVLLLAELPGLEAAKRAIDARIEEIKRQLSENKGPQPILPQLMKDDPTILGRDVLGRIKRKRNLSPEVRAHKRALIAAARDKRLEKARENEVLANTVRAQDSRSPEHE